MLVPSRDNAAMRFLLATLVAAVAAGGAHAATPSLDPARLPALPAQGLVVEKPGGVLLLTTDGRVLGRLAGFSTYPPEKLSDARFARSVGIGALASADPALTVLYDRTGRGWLLDAPGRRLRAIGAIQAPLAGGAVLRVIVDRKGEGVSTRTVVERNGKSLMSGLSVATVGSRYVATDDIVGPRPNAVLDLVSGRRTTIGPRCVLAGMRAGAAIAACSPSDPTKVSTLERVAADGTSRVLATFPRGTYANSASLSPNGRWVLVYLQPNCGPGWAAIAPSGGGPARFVAGGKTLATSPFSFGLGWTADSRIVATVSAKGSCEGESAAGTFTIDPATLERTRAAPAFAAKLWGAQ
jgi:hypothetical protein